MTNTEKEMTFLEHLEEFRWHLIRSVASIFVFAIIAFLSKHFVFHELILGPSRPDFWFYRTACKISHAVTGGDAFCIDQMPFIIQSRKMTGQFGMHVTSSFVIGLILAFPYAFWELWRFISPGLYPSERKASRGATFFVTILFIMGVLFGYYIITPISVNFLAHYQVDASILNEFDITSYVSTVTMIVLASGLVFQLPVIIFFLTKAGIIYPDLLKTYRRHAIVVMLLLGAMLTPPDPMSQILVATPLIVLYEIGIYVSAYVVRKKRKKMLALEAETQQNERKS